MITPNYDRAATKAVETLIKYNIRNIPIDPIPIIKKADGFNVVTFTEMSKQLGIERDALINTFETENRDAITSAYVKDGKTRYIVAYNMRLPQYLIQRALAREIGHIVLGHDGTLPEEVRQAEALCFAYHFICPRAVIHAIQERNIIITTEILGNVTGCFERCLLGMRKTPATHVLPELNSKVKEQFAEYIDEFLSFQPFLAKDDESMIANFGSYMEGYEEL